MTYDVVGPLNRDRLRAIFERERVQPASYNLEGSHGDEACCELLQRVLRDPTTRMR